MKIYQKKGLTQAELSEISKVKYKYLQEIEGKNPPNLRVDTLARIAKALAYNNCARRDLNSQPSDP